MRKLNMIELVDVLADQYGMKSDYAKRLRLAGKARCDGEARAIEDFGYNLGDAECGNCGWSFLSEKEEDEKSRRYCSTYQSHKWQTDFCKQWGHVDASTTDAAPAWIKPGTKQRMDINDEMREIDEAMPPHIH